MTAENLFLSSAGAGVPLPLAELADGLQCPGRHPAVLQPRVWRRPHGALLRVHSLPHGGRRHERRVGTSRDSSPHHFIPLSNGNVQAVAGPAAPERPGHDLLVHCWLLHPLAAAAPPGRSVRGAEVTASWQSSQVS